MSKVVFSKMAITIALVCVIGGCTAPDEIQENREVHIEVVA